MRRWKLPRLRFGLRTFLVFICVVGALLGLAAHRIEKGRERWARIKELQGLGVRLEFRADRQSPWTPGVVQDMNWWQHWKAADQALQLSEVHFASETPARRACELMRGFPNVTSITLSGRGADDLVMDELLRHKKVMVLDLRQSKVTDAGMASLSELPDLQAVYVPPTTTDAGLAHIARLKSIGYIDLSDSAITDRGLRHFAGRTRLYAMNLSNTAITDAGVSYLAGMTSLARLELSGTRVTGECGTILGTLTQLVSLELNQTMFDDVGLAEIRQLVLHRLSLAGTKITDQGLPNLSGSELVELDVSDTCVSGDGLQYLIDCHELETLKLNGTQVDDSDLPVLLRFPAPTELQVRNTRLSSEGEALYWQGIER